MANFTDAEADACLVTRCEEGSNPQGLDVSVKDDAGMEYSWFEADLSETDDPATIKAAMKTTLLVTEKQAASQPLVGQTIG